MRLTLREFASDHRRQRRHQDFIVFQRVKSGGQCARQVGDLALLALLLAEMADIVIVVGSTGIRHVVDANPGPALSKAVSRK